MPVRVRPSTLLVFVVCIGCIAFAIYQLSQPTWTMVETDGTILNVQALVDERTRETVYALTVQFQTPAGDEYMFAETAPILSTFEAPNVPYRKNESLLVHYHPSNPKTSAQVGPIPSAWIVIVIFQIGIIVFFLASGLAGLWLGIQKFRRDNTKPTSFRFRY